MSQPSRLGSYLGVLMVASIFYIGVIAWLVTGIIEDNHLYIYGATGVLCFMILITEVIAEADYKEHKRDFDSMEVKK